MGFVVEERLLVGTMLFGILLVVGVALSLKEVFHLDSSDILSHFPLLEPLALDGKLQKAKFLSQSLLIQNFFGYPHCPFLWVFYLCIHLHYCPSLLYP